MKLHDIGLLFVGGLLCIPPILLVVLVWRVTGNVLRKLESSPCTCVNVMHECSDKEDCRVVKQLRKANEK